MTSMRCTIYVATFVLFTGGVALPRPASATPLPSPQYGYGPDRGGWDAPPPEFQEIQRRGFRDGIGAARQDFARQMRPDPAAHEEFRHPPLPPDLHNAYRDGFRHGYQRAFDHLMAGQRQPEPVQPVPPPPAVFSSGQRQDLQRRGFQEGMLGALHDLDHGRRPDPNNRDEYRNPNVSYPMAEAYRDGFRRGYGEGMQAMTGVPDRGPHGPQGDLWLRGFHEGAAGAIRDWDNHRRPDPNNRDEYRNPGVPYGAADLYREAFRRGYARIAGQIF